MTYYIIKIVNKNYNDFPLIQNNVDSAMDNLMDYMAKTLNNCLFAYRQKDTISFILTSLNIIGNPQKKYNKDFKRINEKEHWKSILLTTLTNHKFTQEEIERINFICDFYNNKYFDQELLISCETSQFNIIDFLLQLSGDSITYTSRYCQSSEFTTYSAPFSLNKNSDIFIDLTWHNDFIRKCLNGC